MPSSLRLSELCQLLPIVTVTPYVQSYWESSMHARMNHVTEQKEPAPQQAHAQHPGTDGYDNLPPVPCKVSFAFPSNYPPPGTPPDRSSGRDDDLRDGAARRISTSIRAHRSLRRVGLGRDRSLGRRAQTSISLRQRRQVNRARCQTAEKQAGPQCICSVAGAITRPTPAVRVQRQRANGRLPWPG